MSKTITGTLYQDKGTIASNVKLSDWVSSKSETGSWFKCYADTGETRYIENDLDHPIMYSKNSDVISFGNSALILAPGGLFAMDASTAYIYI